ncbi:MAG: polysaccharide pyruvyl transferase family protein [Clostridia bacterium]|nr:polysaccharide pyruvyl transferase family protein [Clostridia bacterium]
MQQFLADNGYDTELIDYRPAYYDAGKKKLRTLVGKLLNARAYLVRKRKFESFIKTYDKLSARRFRTFADLLAYGGDADRVLIVGGDQLWNNYHLCGRDDAYKLTFAGHSKKIAYGTSMGRDNFAEEELAALAGKVQDFTTIMLRERSGVEQLNRHGITTATHVIDPVGLLDIEAFRNMAKKPDIKEPYAVMYLADSSPLLDEAIKKLSEEMGLKIVHICGFKKKCYCDVFAKDVGPEEILGYILHADFVLSASFHATMFSLMFNKPFATLLPSTKTNARIEDILSFVGLQDRILRTVADVARLTAPIDYTSVNTSIAEFRNISQEKLLDALMALQED